MEVAMDVSRMLIAGVLSGVSATTAFAQPYVSGELGYASAQFALDAPYNGVVDDRSMMYGINLGFGFARRWALEAGLHGCEGFDGRATPCIDGAVCPLVVQHVDDNNVTVYHLAMVPRVNVGNVRLFGKAGYYHARIDTDIGLPDDRFKENGLLLGAGVRWYFSEPWSVSLEATRYDDNIYQLGVGVGWGIKPVQEIRR
jgi:opacity protein-like surface antigen